MTNEEDAKKDAKEEVKNDEQPQVEEKKEVPTESRGSSIRDERIGKKLEEKPEEVKEVKAEEPKPEEKEEKKEEKPEEKPEPTGKFKELIKQIEGLSVLELAELVKELEQRFGVSAAAPVAMATGASAAPGEEAAVEEKAEFNVILKSSGEQKINVIKAIREITQLGLKDAKDLVDAAPKEVKSNVKKEEAEEIKKKIEAVGGQVELK